MLKTKAPPMILFCIANKSLGAIAATVPVGASCIIVQCSRVFREGSTNPKSNRNEQQGPESKAKA